jgi:hypothetical protein
MGKHNIIVINQFYKPFFMKPQRFLAHRSILQYLSLTLLVFCFSTRVFSQVTTYTFAGSGLNTSLCNVFGVDGVKINGAYFFSCVGGVAFDGTYLNIDCSSGAGTFFLIGYAFVPKATYTITVQAKSTSTSAILGGGAFAQFPSFAESPATCTASTNELRFSTATNYGQVSKIGTTSASYTLMKFTPNSTSDLLYLNIGAYDAIPASTVSISSITITATGVPCNIGVPTQLTTLNSGTTLSWEGLVNAVS